MKLNKSNSPKIIFLHIPKSAGTTFKTILWQQVFPSRIYYLYEWGNHKDRIIQLQHLLKERKKKISLIMGHIGYGIHSYLPGKYQYVTMIRNPLKRVVSMYHHIQRDQKHQLHSLVKNKSLSEYLTSEIDESSTNSQTRFIAGVKLDQEIDGDDDLIGYGKGTPEQMLEQAKINLKNNILFGVTEQFNKSMLLFRKELGWKRIFYSKFNRGNYNPTSLSTQEMNLIVKYNNLDMELYDYAVDLFEKNVEALIPSIITELKDYNKKNKYFGPLFSYPTRLVHKFIELRGNK